MNSTSNRIFSGLRTCNTRPRRSYTRRQIVLFAALASGNFFAALCGSLQAPFFPREAERKGATPTGYGFVFGVFHLAIFLTSPFFGWAMSRVTPKFMLNSGMFVVGVCSLLFGVLNYAPDGATFLTLALVVRIMEGVGSSAFRTAAFTIAAAEFEEVASHFGTLETMYGLGLIIGPTLGGALYEVSGYSLPFLACGAALLICAVLTSLVIPNIEPVSLEQRAVGLLKFVLQPYIMINIVMVSIPALCVGYNQSTLEPHLRQFEQSPLIIGLIFILNGASYAASAPLWGMLCDRKYDVNSLSAIGSVMSFACFFIIGPVPFVPCDTKLSMVLIGLVLFGVGMGAVRVTGFTSSLEEAAHLNMPNDIVTNGLVSGVITSSVSMGLFFGPIAGGYMLENIGYRPGTLVMSSFLFASIILSLITFVQKRTRRRREEALIAVPVSEITPLLQRRTRQLEDSGKGNSVNTFE